MLYFGVCFVQSGFKVTALSQGFATIDEKLFWTGQSELFRQWLAKIKSTPNEPAQWFIDEKDFDNPDHSTDLFRFDDDDNSVFLVNHRALCNMIQFVHEVLAVRKISDCNLNTEFLLASAIRIFHDQHLIPLKTDPLFF